MARRDPLSGDLFAVPQPAPATPCSMDHRAAIAHLLSEMFCKSGLDRYEIASRTSRLVGKDVSKATLDSYTSEAREEWNAPAWILPALETVCGSHAYSEWLATQRGARLLIGDQALHHDLSRLERLREEADVGIRALKAQISRRGIR